MLDLSEEKKSYGLKCRLDITHFATSDIPLVSARFAYPRENNIIRVNKDAMRMSVSY